jgi:hypothetical protein
MKIKLVCMFAMILAMAAVSRTAPKSVLERVHAKDGDPAPCLPLCTCVEHPCPLPQPPQ